MTNLKNNEPHVISRAKDVLPDSQTKSSKCHDPYASHAVEGLKSLYSKIEHLIGSESVATPEEEYIYPQKIHNSKNKKELIGEKKNHIHNKSKESDSTLTTQISEEQKKFRDNYFQNRELIDNICSFIRSKTARESKEIEKLIEEFYNKNKHCDIVTLSGTNLTGYCVLYDDCTTLDYLMQRFSSSELELPKIMGIENTYTVLTKSVEINKSLINFMNKKSVLNESILIHLLSSASEILYRQENIDFYLNWIQAHNSDNNWTQSFVSACMKKNNRPILHTMCERVYFYKAISENLKTNSGQYSPELSQWLMHTLNRVNKDGSHKGKTKLSEYEPINKACEPELIVPTAHLSAAQDRFKMITAASQEEKKEVQVVKKKRLLSST